MTNVALKISENLRSFGVKTAYGDPVELDGTTLVPVALVQFGFGGGSEGGGSEGGDAADNQESGGTGDTGKAEKAGGGGGGGMVVPLGALVTTGGTVRFVPNVVALLAVGIPFVWVAGRALARVIRALKR